MAVLFLVVLSADALADDGSLRVRVCDPEGEPIEGAHVWIAEQEQRASGTLATAASETGSDGLAVLRRTRMFLGLRPWHGRYRLVVSAPGYAVAVREPVFVRAGQQSLIVHLEQGGSVSGVVLTASGDPVADAVVRLRSPGPWAEGSGRCFPETRTAVDGAFRLRHVEPAVHGLLAIGRSGVGWRTVRAPCEGVQIVLQSGITIKGRVDLGPQGSLEGGLSGRNVPYSCRFPIREDGRFVIENVPPGTYLLLGHMVEVASENLEFDFQRPRLENKNSVRVSGSVRTTDGDPVPGAVVETVGPSGTCWHTRARTNADGKFDLDVIRMAGASGRRLAILATADTLVGWGFASLDESDQEVTISLRSAEDTLRVHVVEATTDGPISDAHVIVQAEWRHFRLHSWTDTGGWTEALVGVPDPEGLPGDRSLPVLTQQQWVRVRAGFSHLPFERWVRVDGITELTASLKAKPSFRGRVEDERGQPLPGIRVVCQDGEADTDEKGEFVLLSDRADAKFEDLRWTGLPRLDPGHLPVLPPDPARPGVFVLSGVHRVELRVQFGPEWEGWQAVLGLEVEQAPLFPRGDVDQTGQARFGPVYEGAYVIWARSPAGDRLRNLGLFEVEGDPGSVVTIDLADKGSKNEGR